MDRTNAPGSVAGHYVDKNTDAGIAGTALMKRDREIIQEGLCLPVEDSGFTLDATDNYQLERAIIALSKPVGAVVSSILELTPVPVSASRSSAKPAYPLYNPIIPLHDANHDITTTEVPQSVITALNANKVVVKDGSGNNVSSFTATLASGVLTFANNTPNNNFLNILQEAGMVNRWYSSGEIGLWAEGGALWTGARQYCVTIGGVNYAIIGVSIGSHTITLATYPANGTVTVECYPTRIAGYTNRARLRRVSGEVMQAGGDISSEVGVGLARMHRILGHQHEQATIVNRASAGFENANSFLQGAGGSNGAIFIGDKDPTADGVNSLVTGKTNDTRSFGVGVYLHVGNLLATTWTSAV